MQKDANFLPLFTSAEAGVRFLRLEFTLNNLISYKVFYIEFIEEIIMADDNIDELQGDPTFESFEGLINLKSKEPPKLNNTQNIHSSSTMNKPLSVPQKDTKPKKKR